MRSREPTLAFHGIDPVGRHDAPFDLMDNIKPRNPSELGCWNMLELPKDWPYFYRDLSVRMAKQEVSRPIAGRTLVVVAFFEKTPEYRD